MKGSTFESFLREEGIYDDVKRLSAKKILAIKLQRAMREKGVSTSTLAKKMHTSRPVVYRMLDSKRDVTLSTITKAFEVLGFDINIDLIQRKAIAG